MIKRVPTSSLVPSQGGVFRGENVRSFRERLRRGEKIPPILVRMLPDGFLIEYGHHKHQALIAEGITEADVQVLDDKTHTLG